MPQKSPGWELRLALAGALIQRKDATSGEQVTMLSAALDEDTGFVYTVMLAYLQMLNRESRAKRELAREDARLVLEAKRAGIEAANRKIEAAKIEAAQRAAEAMAAAARDLTLGVVSAQADLTVEFALGMLDQTRPASAVVPDVIGMSEVLANLTLVRAGLQIGLSGSLALGARVTGQEPAAGQVVSYESVVIVDLAGE